jgi:hypothetical protein
MAGSGGTAKHAYAFRSVTGQQQAQVLNIAPKNARGHRVGVNRKPLAAARKSPRR